MISGYVETKDRKELAKYIVDIRWKVTPDWWQTSIFTDPRTLDPVYRYEWYKLESKDYEEEGYES